ncbi:two-component system, LytT family, response regulator [Draconibacterium orientale]|jgi:two-component system LytT family response regulator|uniref:Two-component system, LytT family, response regulator n=1 Tax=Draconibacterium orientale TaxID=1168034 RepID=X5DNZ9_9BACT|nr:LytTR family DNA-binding domain-containing protein [Draconibacterium orientale]AHW62372.1 hypothetical protein FH5T_20435 [Draconibacterium orientale]SET36245.1 two-component system, LytT family, response regulator [Draconibacterium orientale]
MHTPIDKLVLSTRDSYHLIEVESIIYCKSNNSCTTFYLVGGEEIKVSVSMKNVEKRLGNKYFIRPHQSYLVNVQHVKTIQKVSGGGLVLDNGKSITISTRKKGEVLHFLENIKRIQV